MKKTIEPSIVLGGIIGLAVAYGIIGTLGVRKTQKQFDQMSTERKQLIRDNFSRMKVKMKKIES